MTPERCVRVVIAGRVQGVGFRAWVVDAGRRHGLRGWVRNRVGGTVEAVFSGPEDAAQAMAMECRSGPLAARVSSVITQDWIEAVPKGFHMLPTA